MGKFGVFKVRNIKHYQPVSYEQLSKNAYKRKLPSGTVVRFVRMQDDSFVKMVERPNGVKFISDGVNVEKIYKKGRKYTVKKFDRWPAEVAKRIKAHFKSFPEKGKEIFGPIINGKWVEVR